MNGIRLAGCVAIAVWLTAAAARAAAPASLADAAENNDAEAVLVLVEEKAAVNESQADGMTALHWATYHDNLSQVKLLIAAGADAKAANRYGVTPLALACIEWQSRNR